MKYNKFWCSLIMSVVLISHATWAMEQSSGSLFKRRSPPKTVPMKVVDMPVGIKNSGNSCYANSVMQLLMLMDNDFFAIAKRQYFPDGFATELTQEQKFLKRVFEFRAAWQSRRVTTTMTKRKMRRLIDSGITNGIYLWSEPYAQEDATEFFQGIAQFLGNSDYPSFMAQSTIAFLNEEGLSHESRVELIPSGIELAFPPPGTIKRGTVLSFSDLFAGYFVADELTGDNQYEYNQVKYDALKFMQLTGNADYLFVSLKRFYVDNKGRRHKLLTVVNFDNGEVSLGDAVVDRSSANDVFEVVGISMHSGSAYGGHYTARVKYGSQWYRVDDDLVRATDWPTVAREAQAQGYLILLKRKGVAS